MKFVETSQKLGKKPEARVCKINPNFLITYNLLGEIFKYPFPIF
jgi:hypothetical protein